MICLKNSRPSPISTDIDKTPRQRTCILSLLAAAYIKNTKCISTTKNSDCKHFNVFWGDSTVSLLIQKDIFSLLRVAVRNPKLKLKLKMYLSLISFAAFIDNDANELDGENNGDRYLNPNTHMRAILNKSLRQHPTRHQLYSHLPPITKTIQVRRARHAGHCWRSKDELVSDVLLWTPTYGQAKAGRPARTYIQQLCEDTRCNPEDLPEAMNDREKWREMVRDIRAGGTT